MTDPVKELLDLLDIEQLELDLFRGESPPEEASLRVFGGQVIAQALVAAYRTVENRPCHSLHAYFIRPGDPKVPIIYQVDHSRDGRCFTTSRVVAIQHGKQIYNLAASLHVDEEGWEHQADMPNVQGPDGLPTYLDLLKQAVERMPEKMRNRLGDFFTRERPIEQRPVNPTDMLKPAVDTDDQHIWIRVPQPIDEAPWVHQCMLAYASDMALLGTAQRYHGVTWMSGEVMGASLDHAMWFHAPLNFNDWHLYTMDAPYAGGARSFNRGMIFSQDGKLVASCAQEGLMRPVKRNRS